MPMSDGKKLPDDLGHDFYYLDENGDKQDADLHAAILGPVDHPIDEKIMAPIRARHRAKHEAKKPK